MHLMSDDECDREDPRRPQRVRGASPSRVRGASPSRPSKLRPVPAAPPEPSLLDKLRLFVCADTEDGNLTLRDGFCCAPGVEGLPPG